LTFELNAISAVQNIFQFNIVEYVTYIVSCCDVIASDHEILIVVIVTK